MLLNVAIDGAWLFPGGGQVKTIGAAFAMHIPRYETISFLPDHQ
jgi:hypothetical protein